MLKTKADLFYYLCDQKFDFLAKAQEAEDLSNPEAAAELRAIADHLSTITKRLVAEMGA